MYISYKTSEKNPPEVILYAKENFKTILMGSENFSKIYPV